MQNIIYFFSFVFKFLNCFISLTSNIYSKPSVNQDWAAQEQSLRLFNLQLERERLKRRQQEIKLNVSVSSFMFGLVYIYIFFIVDR